jgi:membrane associated rhomboid family serine protease
LQRLLPEWPRTYDCRVIPVGDSNPTRSPAFVNWLLIATNIAVFVYTLTLNTRPDDFLLGEPTSAADRFLISWGVVPACIGQFFGFDPNVPQRVLSQVCPPGSRELLQPFTSMFLHAGWLHIAGNMLFLWIFGDNVEDSMGHLRYLVFYFICGLVAAVTQTVLTIHTTVPAVGASGAIAGVLAAYLILYPRAMIRVIILPIFFFSFLVPAIVLIGFWFLTQLVSGAMTIGNATAGSGVAWWAHVGGFTAGAVLIWFFRKKERMRRPLQWGMRV